MTSMLGRQVIFQEWDDESGEEILLQGTVEEEFAEPPEEDAYQRLNYRVRTPMGRCYTPYACECRPIDGPPCGIRAVGWQQPE
jgi:hypothetical protein